MAAVEGTTRRVGDAVGNTTHDLYRQYGRQIYAYCYHRLRSREEAEDAVQTTFMNAFRALQRGAKTQYEQAWLFKIAQNVCIARSSSSARRLRLEAPNDFEVLQEIVPAQNGEGSLDLIGVEDALEQMPENQRRAILLREWQGLSYREIGEELQLSQAAVEMLIFRARRALAGALEQPTEKKQHRVGRKVGSLGSILGALKTLLGGGAAIKAAAVAAAAIAVVGESAQHTIVHRTSLAPVRHPVRAQRARHVGSPSPAVHVAAPTPSVQHVVAAPPVPSVAAPIARTPVDKPAVAAAAPAPALVVTTTAVVAPAPVPAPLPTPAPPIDRSVKSVEPTPSPAPTPAPAPAPQPRAPERAHTGTEAPTATTEQPAPPPPDTATTTTTPSTAAPFDPTSGHGRADEHAHRQPAPPAPATTTTVVVPTLTTPPVTTPPVTTPPVTTPPVTSVPVTTTPAPPPAAPAPSADQGPGRGHGHAWGKQQRP